MGTEEHKTKMQSSASCGYSGREADHNQLSAPHYQRSQQEKLAELPY